MALEELEPGEGGSVGGSPRPPAHTTISRFMPTSRRIVQFSDGVPAPPGARIVYIDGGFDLFHPGHVEILKVHSRILPWEVAHIFTLRSLVLVMECFFHTS